MTIPLDETLRLEVLSETHADALFEAVDRNRSHLSEFLPWVETMQSTDDFRRYVRTSEALFQEKKDVSFAILLEGVPVGRIGLHYIHPQNKNAAIGYWLARNAEGRGIVTRACQALLAYGFGELGLQRIELKAAVGNGKSRAIAGRLKFTQEGILRQAERVNGRFLDLVVYSMVRDEWTR